MGEETARLRQEIERTRGDLTRDVDLLADKTSLSRIMERRVERTRRGVVGLKDRVMGGSSSAASSLGDSAHDAMSSVSQAPGNAVEGARRQAEGNPLAAGLVAFGVGWLVSSLLPASEPEKSATRHAADQAQQHGGAVMDQAKQAAQEVGGNLKESAQDAAEQVKLSAQDAASTVKSEATPS